jgi:hypothetical protein
MLHERPVCQIRGSLPGLLGAMVRSSGYCSPSNSGTLGSLVLPRRALCFRGPKERGRAFASDAPSG